MLTHVRKRDVLLVRLEGELDQCSASGIRRDIDALLQDPSVRHLVLDMERMPFMDSSGIGVVLGSVAALRRNKFIDKAIMVITTAFISMPSFIMGSLLLVLFSVKLALFPANGEAAGGLVLPIITLALYPLAHTTRLTRSSMLDVLGQDYIRTAKAKGVSGSHIIFGHALKNALIPVITYFGPMLAYIVTGSLVVEQIFAVPGIGRAFVNSITNRDYPLIMGTTIVLATLIVVMNLVSDILYKAVDPRITLE